MANSTRSKNEDDVVKKQYGSLTESIITKKKKKKKGQMTHIQEIKNSDDASIYWFSSGFKKKTDIKPFYS